jgi:hypothetical protein
MTPQRFEQCLAALGWTHRWLADYLSVRGVQLSRHQVDRMGNGAAVIPPSLADWLERRVRSAAMNPFPDGWGRAKAARRRV